MSWSKNKKNRYTPVNPSFSIETWGSMGYTFHGRVFLMWKVESDLSKGHVCFRYFIQSLLSIMNKSFWGIRYNWCQDWSEFSVKPDCVFCCALSKTFEPVHEKTNNLHRWKQRRRSASRLFAVTVKLISAFVFATRIVQSLSYLNTKFQASNHLLWLYKPVCVRPDRNPNCWFSHAQAHFTGVMKMHQECF